MSNSKLFKSSIGKKFLMGITGLFLISFLVVHCFVNGLIFLNDGGETFNEVAHLFATNWLIRTLEIVLFLGLILHIVDGLMLWVQNNKARPVKYAVSKASKNSTWYSRSMGLLGTLLLMFLVVHLKDFWVLTRFTDHIAHSEATKLPGQETLFEEMIEVFHQPWVVAVYLFGMISLAYHLLHGFSSAFQTLGLNHKKYTPFIKAFGIAFSIIIPLIFALMPVAMHFGWIK
jgi:succinate dehydrogenase / fumarate reductase, cytochrome b subunit